jgi:hypothetical protein
MSVSEVRSLAQKLGAAGIQPFDSSRPDGLQGYWMEERNTKFYLGFQGGSLIKVQQARGYGLTGLELSPEENLCGSAVERSMRAPKPVPDDTDQ